MCLETRVVAVSSSDPSSSLDGRGRKSNGLTRCESWPMAMLGSGESSVPEADRAQIERIYSALGVITEARRLKKHHPVSP